MIKIAVGDHGDGNPFDGQYGILAHAYYPPPSGGSLAGDAHFEDDEQWNEDFLMRVALHEIGHSLGLPHSDIKEAVMFPYIDPDATGSKKTLHISDIAANKRIYP
ncbi:peptidase M10, metallopeptidase [Aspergillus transmontanensis]|uniref:Peptidase M10, metallopeptidase n=1 Tax=Aspergillus transmontanensis TaxID=1034304 RepID=A0A5N6VX14_9EURO|nr:peptidase M10, metallopeptidase [Aspergillus transmontanensis]